MIHLHNRDTISSVIWMCSDCSHSVNSHQVVSQPVTDRYPRLSPSASLFRGATIDMMCFMHSPAIYPSACIFAATDLVLLIRCDVWVNARNPGTNDVVGPGIPIHPHRRTQSKAEQRQDEEREGAQSWRTVTDTSNYFMLRFRFFLFFHYSSASQKILPVIATTLNSSTTRHWLQNPERSLWPVRTLESLVPGKRIEI